MFRWIIGASLKFRFLVIAAAAAMVALGAERIRDMPMDVFPEFAPPRVELQTEGIGMTTAEIEELVTIPMEEALNGTPDLDVIRSKSVTALSSITLIFKQGTDVLRDRQLVQERVAIASARLPVGVGPPIMLQPLSATSRVMKIGLSSDKMSLLDLSMTAYWKIRFRLLRVQGVANVAMWGEKLKQLQIQVDPDLMRLHDVTLNDTVEAASDALDFGLLPSGDSAKAQIVGFVETPNQRMDIQPISPVIGPEDLARTPLPSKSGKTLRLGDIANTLWEMPLQIGDAVVNDGPGLLLIVEKFPWANTLDVTRGVEAALDEMRPGLPDIDINSRIFRPASFIEASIGNLTRALIIGSVLVVVVLGAFLFEWRVALISVVAIPLSLMVAALVLHLREATINTMVLAGFVVALGSIVDDAIIDVENIVRRLREHRRQGGDASPARVILEASLEIRGTILYATLIIVLAVAPVFFLGGLSGAFFAPLALSYSLALLASMAVALVVTPALCLILLRNAKLQHVSPVVARLQRSYQSVLSRIIGAPRLAFAVTAVLAVVGAAVWPMLGEELLPEFKERDFLMHWVTAPGTSQPEMFRITQRASRDLRSIPGVKDFGAHIGRALVADEVVNVSFAENWLSVAPNVDLDETVETIEERLQKYPGIFHNIETYLRERIEEVLTGASTSIVVRIFGPELSELRRLAKEVHGSLDGMHGLAGVHEELQTEIPQVQITVDLEKAGKVGLKPGDVRRAAAVIFAGIEVSDMHQEGRVYDVQLWSKPEARHSLTSIRELLLDTPAGGRVRLGDVADVKIAPTPNVIRRENSSRRMDVEVEVAGRDIGATANEVQQRLDAIKLPLGYHVELLGEAEESAAAKRRLLISGLVTVIAIFLLLQASFRSWRLAALASLTLPSALVGGVLAAFASDGIISLGSLVGLLAVLGIAARNSILLINHYRHLEDIEGEPFGPGLVLRGARERLSPILMTTLATGLALVPLAITGEIPGQEIEHPMAVVILGGLVTSTLLNLFIVPVLYLRLRRSVTFDSLDHYPEWAVTV